MKKINSAFAYICVLLLLTAPFLRGSNLSFKEGVVIRDAEVEDILRLFADPIFKAAGLNPADVKLFLLADSTVNALAAPGPMIFVNTGLIIKCERVEEVIAVLAHETGHVVRKHLIGRLEAFQNATMPYLLSMGIGAIISILTGTPDGLMLGSALGQQVGTRSFLTFSRTQEMQADLVSQSVLSKLRWPLDGSITLFERMQRFSTQPSAKAIYTQTHPAMNERIEMARKNLDPSFVLPPLFSQNFERLKIKILAHMLPPGDVFKDSFIQKSSFRDYAYLIALHRQGLIEKASNLLHKMLKKTPQDPYLYEIATHIYLEQGKKLEAQKAINHIFDLQTRPHISFYILKARLLIKEQHAKEEVRTLLQHAILSEPSNPEPWYWLSILAGEENRPAALYYLAEYNVRIGRMQEARKQVKIAKKNLPQTDPLYIHLADLELLLEDQKKRMQTL